MRPPDCILVRMGELALKSDQVQRKWFNILLQNVNAGLKEEGIEYRIEVNPNRIFVFTKDIEKAIAVLRKVFGIVSVSPVWQCHSELAEIRLLATDIAEQVLKLDEKKSFAIRARRAGHHKFSSKLIAEEAGAAVKRITNAQVNLSKPEFEIEIECRSRNTYIFTEKISAVGGLPLGTGGKVLALLEKKEDAFAALMIAKRGCELVLLAKSFEAVEKIKNFYIGREIELFAARNFSEIDEILDEENIGAVVSGEQVSKKILKILEKRNVLFLRPLEGLPEKEESEIFESFSLKSAGN
ncbi:MAG TPA: THUMP domain-containing protein [archaeon]|nr:THUMP domain-containing protein [archaeon]